jgi:hypothetical protein
LAPASVAELTEEMSSAPRRSALAISEDATIEPLTVVTEATIFASLFKA